MNLRQNRSEAGFTLLETMIAVAIMTVAFGAILMVESSAIKTTTKAKQLNVVAMLAKNLMIETEHLIEGKKFSEAKKEESAQFAEPFQDYKWKREVKEIKFPNIGTNAASAGEGGAPAGGAAAPTGTDQATETLTKLITKFLSDAVREVRITITWKKGQGEQNYSVSTYWVDLNHEFQLSQ